MANNEGEVVPPRQRSGGPHPGALAAVSLGLTLLGLVLGAILAGGDTYPSPFSGAATISSYFQEHVAATRICGFLQFGAAVPLGICAATIYVRQLRLGIRVPGPAIGLVGGGTASIFLMLSGLITWVLSRPEISHDSTLVQAFAFLGFACGGVGFVVGMGLLVAGLAVPALILRLVPRWMAWTGLVLAGLCELSFLSLLVEPLQVFLPIGRFGGLVWLTAAGFMIPVHRPRANRSGQ